MNSATERWKQWEGQLVDGKFPLRRWLASTDHSVVFVTESATNAQCVLKLIPEDQGASAQASRWAEAAKLSHRHLIRLFAHGRCTIDGVPLLYVVMEYAEENLGEIIPVRALSTDEALEMLRPAAEGLAFLHRSSFVHSRIKPSNILAVGDKLKLSSDGLCRAGQLQDAKLPTAFDAAEVATSGFSPAADICSLGITLISVLTQTVPKSGLSNVELRATLQRVPEQLRSIVQGCLQNDPGKRTTAEGILQELSGRGRVTPAPIANVGSAPQRDRHFARQIIIPVVIVAALLIAVLIANRSISHQPSAAVSQSQSPNTQPDLSPNPAPTPTSQSAAHSGVVPGSVLNRVLPDISPGARHTITGHIKINVEVKVDASGNVSSARLKTAGPSRYFSTRAEAAAHQWKFTPAQVNGNPVPSEWLLRFQFARSGVQVSPAEVKP